ncbi:phosphate signaling complex protein PhoU [Sandaracinobacter sp. RS1-74]|uniref:phosphate signaling complex protein PhoU n=1 Tax=Sandaracinobacteroides sayramensis TaxID=2913411 RepID=UPI001EDAF493|nr:phosphate signaling complex protein PhoU [Sandaracinobacteroides sayramensis]MCG2841039.1 phosphate signaling complex protein PhoU [Sandaracinobacteroides sayramensis]
MTSSEKPHTVSSFDEDLLHMRTLVIQMGALAHAQVSMAIDVLEALDASAARAIVANDGQIDRLQVEAELLAVQIFSRHAPLAEDLRDVLASLRVVSALERVGDYAKNIARRTVRMAELSQNGAVDAVGELGQGARALLRDVMAAFLDRDVAKAASVVAADEAVDRNYNKAFGTLLNAAEQPGAPVESLTHLQFIAKHFERIADQATNIAEQIQYAEGGAIPAERHTPADDVD